MDGRMDGWVVQGKWWVVQGRIWYPIIKVFKNGVNEEIIKLIKKVAEKSDIVDQIMKLILIILNVAKKAGNYGN